MKTFHFLNRANGAFCDIQAATPSEAVSLLVKSHGVGPFNLIGITQ